MPVTPPSYSPPAQENPASQMSWPKKSSQYPSMCGAGRTVRVSLFVKPFANSLHAGFPPCDESVKDFFEDTRTVRLRNTSTNPIPLVSADAAYAKGCAFLSALFEVTEHYVRLISSGHTFHDVIFATGQSLAAKFRLLMAKGTEYKRHGKWRTDFFSKVIQIARAVSLLGDKSRSS
jgi:hypothetical protein